MIRLLKDYDIPIEVIEMMQSDDYLIAFNHTTLIREIKRYVIVSDRELQSILAWIYSIRPKYYYKNNQLYYCNINNLIKEYKTIHSHF